MLFVIYLLAVYYNSQINCLAALRKTCGLEIWAFRASLSLVLRGLGIIIDGLRSIIGLIYVHYTSSYCRLILGFGPWCLLGLSLFVGCLICNLKG